MQITASMVKELRDQTAAGMMDCKKALTECGGDFEQAVDWLRKKGISKAAKKADRAATEGLVAAASAGNKGAMVEVNAETDFVAKNEEFKSFVEELAKVVLNTGITDIEKLNATAWPKGGTVEEKLTALISKIGENMTLRRAAYSEVESGVVGSYIHMGGKIGVLVSVSANEATEELAEGTKNVAMHVAATSPQALNRESLDPASIARERAIFEEQAKASGKPAAILEKIIDGRINKFYEEACLVDQAFVMDTDRKVSDVVASLSKGATITGYTRFGLGEGLEKKEDNFAAEVAAAVGA